MGFRINTNVAALSAHANALSNNRAIDSSLGRLNSGFRINSAADDASGMAIADSLRSQASSLGKAIMNANDAIGIVQTADKAMDEQIKILDTIKEKAIQSAQDGQTTETRKALQADISRLMEELDNIGNTTSFNGQKLLSGTFSNKEFQIGAYSNETVKASIGATTSDKIGLTRFETGHNVRASDLTSVANFTFKNVDGINDVTFEPVQLADDSGNIKAGMGLGALMEAINKASDKTGVKASVTVQSVFEQPIKAGSTTAGFSINGVMIGAIDVKEKDGNGALRSAINSVKDQTGVEASVDSKGRLVLANRDGRGIKVEDNVTASKPATDLHDLVTNTATGTIKKGVDLNLKTTWDSTAATGNILNKSNSFADVKMAHGVQDTVIFGNASKQAAKAIESIPSKALGTFKEAEQKALKEFKTALSSALDTFMGAPAQANPATAADKAKANTAASDLKDKLDGFTDLKSISDAYTKFDALASSQTTAIGALQASVKTALDAYHAAVVNDATNHKDAAGQIIKDLAGADLSVGSGKIVAEATATLQGTTAPAGGTAANFATYAAEIDKFNTSVGSVLGAELDLSSLDLGKDGALNLISDFKASLTTTKSVEAEALGQLKTDLIDTLKTSILDAKAATGKEADKATLDNAIKGLIGKIENAKDVAEIGKEVKATLATNATANKFEDATFSGQNITGVQTALGKVISNYADKIGEQVTKLENATAGAAAGTDANTANGEATTLKGAATTAKTAMGTPAQVIDGFETFATAVGTFDTATNSMPVYDGLMKEALVGFNKLQEQTTLSGANAAIDNLNGTLDRMINDAKGKSMDTQEAQNGMIAHAMKQFLSGVKAGLNEPNAEGLSSIIGLNTENSTNFGRLSLSSTNGRDIQVEVRDANGYTTNSTVGYDKNVSEKTVSLRETNSTIDRDTADAMGFNSEEWQAGVDADNQNGYPAGVMTLKGAQAMMNIAEAAAKALQAVRSDLGSVQNQLVATVNNISVTQVNVKAAESNIRDVDFAQESATFSKHQILAQSGVYAMSQANAVQQNVMRLLQ